MSKIILSMDGRVLKEYPLDKERLTIGRKPENDIHIDNLAVSGRHAAVVTILNDSFLEDLGSTNGTLVNGNPVQKHFLQDNDLIEIGKYKMKYIAGKAMNAEEESDMDKTMVLRKSAKPAAPAPSAEVKAADGTLNVAPAAATAPAPAAVAKPAAPAPSPSAPVQPAVDAAAKFGAPATPVIPAAPMASVAPMTPIMAPKPAAAAVPVPAAATQPAPPVTPAAEKPVIPAVAVKPAAATAPTPVAPVATAIPPAVPASPVAVKPAVAAPAPAAPAPGAVTTLAAIQILSGPNAGKEMDLAKTLTTLGKPGVQVAVITRRPHGYFITHVEGANFPTVGGEKLDTQPRQLKDHDIIELAGVKMEFFVKA